jgi:hypothetical protein
VRPNGRSRARSGGLTDATGFRHVRWELLRLPPELILARDEFLADPRWHGRTPFVAKQRARGRSSFQLTIGTVQWL